MAKVVVTGAAGFIGSHLCEALLNQGQQVLGVDSFTSYYDPRAKERNIAGLTDRQGFELTRVDLSKGDLDQLVDDADIVYHLAAQPGVRLSWQAFSEYVSGNLVATERLLGALSRRKVPHLVFASSSSIYGNASTYPTRESSPLEPRSPYGVTKLAGEKLLAAYVQHHEFTAYSMRFFTVYGPRQRPDMAIQRMLLRALHDEEFELYGDGSAVRDFTYVEDIVDACIRAGTRAPIAGHLALNIGGSGGVTMRGLLKAVETVTERPLRVRYSEAQAGDVTRTGADTSLVEKELDWLPRWQLVDGLRAQWAHITAHEPPAGMSL